MLLFKIHEWFSIAARVVLQLLHKNSKGSIIWFCLIALDDSLLFPSPSPTWPVFHPLESTTFPSSGLAAMPCSL